MSELITLHPEYAEWIKNVGANFRQCQIKAASKVNEEMLRFYWNLGKEMISLKEKSNLGNKFYEIVSKDLREELPKVKSFSPTNLKYMQYFYELYGSPQVVDSCIEDTNPQVVDSNEVIFKIPWGNDNQTVGLLICKPKDNVLAKYAVNATNVPIGISEYDMNNLIPEDYKSSMQTIEEIEEELR